MSYARKPPQGFIRITRLGAPAYVRPWFNELSERSRYEFVGTARAGGAEPVSRDCLLAADEGGGMKSNRVRFHVRDDGAQYVVERFINGRRERAADIAKGSNAWEARARAQALADALNEVKESSPRRAASGSFSIDCSAVGTSSEARISSHSRDGSTANRRRRNG
jgi:hypothetical protein